MWSACPVHVYPFKTQGSLRSVTVTVQRLAQWPVAVRSLAHSELIQYKLRLAFNWSRCCLANNTHQIFKQQKLILIWKLYSRLLHPRATVSQSFSPYPGTINWLFPKKPWNKCILYTYKLVMRAIASLYFPEMWTMTQREAEGHSSPRGKPLGLTCYRP